MNKPVTVRDVREIDMGSHAVIEASAGTGKTYTIESLFVRALLESSPDRLRPLKIDEILAVTFTEKATGELKERIRSKINGLLHKKDTPGSDKELQERDWKNSTANIFTIHGFCKTILRSYAFENGEPFIMQVEDDGVLYSRMLKDQMRKLWKGWFGEDLATLLEISGFSEDSSWLDDTASMASMYRPECGERILPELSGKPQDSL